jgi:hypothetical protein
MKTYTFETVCASGTTKTFTCQAQDFAEARTKLSLFVGAN